MTGLFDPIRIGRLTLPNRIIMPPLTRGRAGDAGISDCARSVPHSPNNAWDDVAFSRRVFRASVSSSGSRSGKGRLPISWWANTDKAGHWVLIVQLVQWQSL